MRRLNQVKWPHLLHVGDKLSPYFKSEKGTFVLDDTLDLVYVRPGARS